MGDQRTRRTRRALILAAGNGDRFHSGSGHSKLLTTVAGTALLTRTLRSAFDAGIRHAHIVLGYDADAVRALAEAEAPAGLALHFHENAGWHQENGVSVLAARDGLDGGPFALLMGDHVFDGRVLRRLLHEPRRPGETLLCVDASPRLPGMADEATRVRMDGDRITAIGKMLQPYDALDTGLFVCDGAIFRALERACAEGDSTLTAGVRQQAAGGNVRGVRVECAGWCDVDTVDDLALAERVLAGTAVP
jgi:choline kinase